MTSSFKRYAVYSVALLLGAVTTFTAFSAETAKHSVVPKNGLVPDEQTAVRIAEAVWLPIYGEGIYQKKPFVARLNGDAWIVKGSLPIKMLGGVPLIEISRTDGRVLRVTHSQ